MESYRLNSCQCNAFVTESRTVSALLRYTPIRRCHQGLAKLLRLSGKHGRGKVAYLSLEDYDQLSRFSWSVNPATGYANSLYGAKGPKRQPVYLHRIVLVRTGKLEHLRDKSLTDHIDGNRLNDARWNLRNATFTQNSHNSAQPRDGATPYKGVATSSNGPGFIAQIRHEGKHLATPAVETAKEAALIYDALARFYRGEYAKTNFAGLDAYDIREARRRVRAAAGRRFYGTFKVREGVWRATISVNYKTVYIGWFPTEEAAARAVDTSLVAHGLARKNFPG